MQYPLAKTCLIFPLLWLFNSSFAQTITQDSLISLEYHKLYDLNERGFYPKAIDQGEAFLSHLTNPDTNTLAFGNLLMVIGAARYNYGSEADSTYAYLQKALRIFTRLRHPRMADAYERLGEFHYYYTQDTEQALLLLEQAEVIHLEQHPVDSSKLCSVYMNMLFVNTAVADYSAALAAYQKALKIQKDHYDAGNLCNAMGDFYYQQSLYLKGMEFFSTADYHFRIHYGDTSTVATFGSIYANKGNCYMSMGDYAKAIHFYAKAQQIFEKKLSTEHPYILKIKAYIGFCYADSDHFDEAENILSPLNHLVAGQDPALQLSILNKLAYCYSKQKKMTDLKDVMGQILPVLATHPYPTSLDQATATRTVGNNYSIVNDYQEAHKYYLQAIHILDTEVSEKVKIRDYLNMDLGYLYFNLQQPDSSIFYFEKALSSIQTPEQKTTIEYYYITYGLSLSKYQYFLMKDTPNQLDEAIALMEESVSSMLQLRNSYTEDADKQYLNSDGNEVFEKLIEMYMSKNTLSPSIDHIKRCFWLSEQNKNTLLLDNMIHNNLGEAGVWADSIKSCNQLVNRLSRTIHETEKSDDISQLSYLRTQYVEAQYRYDQLLTQLKTQYPKYHELFFQSVTTTVDIVQTQLLEPDQALLEYFVGDNTIFLFIIRPDTCIVHEVKRDFPLDNWIENFRQGIYGYYTAERPRKTKDLQNKSLSQYLEYAPKLYGKLFSPIEKLLPEKVIMVPDGPIGYIPFDALLTSMPEDVNNFNDYPFLFNSHQFSYTYSSTFLKEMRTKTHYRKPPKVFVAFAPFYTEKTSGNKAQGLAKRGSNNFDLLLYSKSEVDEICKTMGGDKVIGAAASKRRFMEVAGDYRILHLATHGVADHRAGDYAFLVFASENDSIENEFLYAKDIYNLEINTDMVVLSACETGVGKLQRGEGIISLSRALSYAGTKSIITSLWQVNNKSTSELMCYFYKHLRQGESKDQALRSARRDYFASAEGRDHHPFFWAAFIPVGDMRPIQHSE